MVLHRKSLQKCDFIAYIMSVFLKTDLWPLGIDSLCKYCIRMTFEQDTIFPNCALINMYDKEYTWFCTNGLRIPKFETVSLTLQAGSSLLAKMCSMTLNVLRNAKSREIKTWKMILSKHAEELLPKDWKRTRFHAIQAENGQTKLSKYGIPFSLQRSFEE